MAFETDLPLARRDLIAARLAAGQPVVAGALAAEFNVSEDAIRRDLRALAAAGLCRRVYGGALPLAAHSRPLAERAETARDRKQGLANFAAACVRAGELLFLDSSSTNLVLAERLPDVGDVTVATNSIDIASLLLRRPDVRLVVIGGVVSPAVGGSVDAGAIDALRQLNIDRCFLGACGVSAAGLSAVHADDAAFKRALAANSRELVVLATNDKLGQRAAHRIADLGAVATICVEHDADEREVQALIAAGAHVARVPGKDTA